MNRRNSAIVLGPNVWEPNLKTKSVLTIEPRLARSDIASRLRMMGVPAFILEEEKKRQSETHTGFFLRSITDQDVQTILVYWPLGARIIGMETEFGHLLEWLERGFLSPNQVYLLIERGHIRDDVKAGVMSINEPGNRTQWHEDFGSYGVAQRLWSTEGALFRHIGSIGIEHQARKPTKWALNLIARHE